MKKLPFLLVAWALALSATAQKPQPHSLRLWFLAEFRDSLPEVRLRPQVVNLSNAPGYFFYQIRVTDAASRPGEIREKISGLVFAPPGDTVEILEKTLTISPDDDFNVFLYLLEDEFVVADTRWNFDDAFSAFKNRKAKPKAAPVFLAKDDFEIDVLVFNETRTPFGREFYRKFMEGWVAPKGVSGFWVTIRESLTPGRHTLISIHLNNKELFQRYLVPRPDYISDLAAQTVNYLTSLLSNSNYDGSLTTEDLFGKGVN